MSKVVSGNCDMAVPSASTRRVWPGGLDVESAGQAAAPTVSDQQALACELAAEVLRSSGHLRLRLEGASMLPALWPGDILSVSSVGPADAVPGDIVVYKRGGRLVTHRVVEVRMSATRSPQFEVRGRRSGPSSAWRVPNTYSSSGPEAYVPYPVFVTRGDSAGHDDDPVRSQELLGRVTAIERGSQRFTPHQSLATKLASWILSRSDLAMWAVLKLAGSGS
jgi:signal peptidase